jgi:hypothetical protein
MSLIEHWQCRACAAEEHNIHSSTCPSWPRQRVLRTQCMAMVTVPAATYRGAVSDRDALRLMLSRLLDVALVDGYGETVADEARALLTTTGGR